MNNERYKTIGSTESHHVKLYMFEELYGWMNQNWFDFFFRMNLHTKDGIQENFIA